MLRRGDSADAQITLEVRNRVGASLRVEELRWAYVSEDGVLRVERPGEGFFQSTRFARDRRLERDGRIVWQGICLTDIPAGATRVRFEAELTTRRRGASRKLESLTVDLVAAPEEARVRLPFRGYWRVTQGHACGSNHRSGGRGGEFAWDFAAVDRSGSLMPEDARHNEESPTFGRPVLAPAGGIVRRVVDEHEDNDALDEFPRRSLLDDLKRPDWVYGNYVVLEIAEGRFLLFAHLAKGSAAVSTGERVDEGALLARSGNSGNSMRPHLHVHAMDRLDPADPKTRGVPIRFLRYVEIRGGGSGEDLEVVVRRMEDGTPPEGSVVAPSEATD